MKLNKKLQGLAPEGGFTLIEMLIVVAIIAILVAIAVPALQSAKTDAQDAKIDTVLSSISLAKTRFELKRTAAEIADFNDLDNDAQFAAIQPYLLINGTTPADIATLVAGTGETTVTIGDIGDEPAF